ncbi:hypothetical protein HKX48_003007, partial [Thoreauomyces humboldtii]
MRHLHAVSVHSTDNKMTAENIAIVMAPGMECVVELLVDRFSDVFGEDQDGIGIGTGN